MSESKSSSSCFEILLSLGLGIGTALWVLFVTLAAMSEFGIVIINK